jgi:hypothetical protein
MNSSGNQDFDAVGSKDMDMWLGKRSGVIETTSPTIDTLDSGVQGGGYATSTFRVTANPTDVSGIERVEFYIAKSGEQYKSLKISRTPPYYIDVNPLDYAYGQYYIKAISYDIYWNYTQTNLGPITLTGVSPLSFFGIKSGGASFR